MNHLTKKFIEQFEAENPNFRRMYYPVADMYDADLDMFHIEEVQDEYEEFKQGVDCE